MIKSPRKYRKDFISVGDDNDELQAEVDGFLYEHLRDGISIDIGFMQGRLNDIQLYLPGNPRRNNAFSLTEFYPGQWKRDFKALYSLVKKQGRETENGDFEIWLDKKFYNLISNLISTALVRPR